MTLHKYVALGLIIAMLLVIGVLLPSEQSSPESQASRLLPDLYEQLESVSSVQVTSLIDEHRVTLRRSEQGWVVSEKDDYPADFQSILELLTELAELDIAEVKTARADNHGLLQVNDQGENAGTLVVLQPVDVALIVGKSSSGKGSFVRHQKDNQVYLTDKTITVTPDLLSWVDPVAIDLDLEEVAEVSIATRQAGYLRAVRDPETKALIVQDLPEDRELKYESMVDSLGRTLVNLRFLDVMPYQPEQFKDPGMLRMTTTSGEVIRVSSVSMKSDAGEDRFLAHIDTEQRVAWQYEISEYNFNELNKTLEDLLTPLGENGG